MQNDFPDCKLPVCPYCKKALIIKKVYYDGVLFFRIVHGKKDKKYCGIHLYDYCLKELVRFYCSLEWHKKWHKLSSEEKQRYSKEWKNLEKTYFSHNGCEDCALSPKEGCQNFKTLFN